MSKLGELIRDTKRAFSDDHLFSKRDLLELFKREFPSFSDQLPFAGYDKHSETFILEDLVSRAVCLTVSPIPTEGLHGSTLAEIRDAVETVYSLFEERLASQGSWVLQEYSYEDNNIPALMDEMRRYVRPHAKGTKFTEEYLKMMEFHYRSISREDGLFVDKTVTGEKWRFSTPRVKLIIYRRQSDSDIKRFKSGKHDPAYEVNNLVEDILSEFERAGIWAKRDSCQDVFRWLFEFFNPNPNIAGFKDKQAYYETMSDIDPDVLFGRDFCEALLTDMPESSREDSCWYFNKDVPVRFLRLSSLRKSPRIGQLTGEVQIGIGNNIRSMCARDSLPPGTVLTKTIIFTPQTEFVTLLSKAEKASRGESDDSRKLATALAVIDNEIITTDRYKVRLAMGVYISGSNLDELNARQRKVITTLQSNNIVVYHDEIDGLNLKSFLVHLPMNFRPEHDQKRYFQRSAWAQHAANLSLIFGRTEGTGNPCISMFNRGGTPVFIDPYNSDDKLSNSFGFVVGPPGSGKSVTLTMLTYSIMAIHRPRLFIIEYGGSFDLAAEDFAKKGMVVNKVNIMPESAPSLAPFADIDLVLDDTTLSEEELINNFKDDDPVIEETDTIQEKNANDMANEKRDVLGELELILLMMITGSEQKELDKLSRAQRALARRAIINTAKRQREKGIQSGLGKAKPTIVSDIIDTFNEMSRSDEFTDSQQQRIKEMSLSLEGFTSGLNAKLFNQVGENWPDADLTLVNLGVLAQDANLPLLNVAFASLMQRINNLSEAFQYDPRDIVIVIDEAHLELQNAMTAKLLIKQVKTSRKLGAWPMFATQNVTDLSGEATKLLSMIEWFYCLNLNDAEVNEIAKYKKLDKETKALLTSTKKQSRAYTEGVILSPKRRDLFRAVLPSLILAIAMTESSEKAQRRELMREMNLSEDLEAAYEMANQLNKARGIEGRFEYKDLL